MPNVLFISRSQPRIDAYDTAFSVIGDWGYYSATSLAVALQHLLDRPFQIILIDCELAIPQLTTLLALLQDRFSSIHAIILKPKNDMAINREWIQKGDAVYGFPRSVEEIKEILHIGEESVVEDGEIAEESSEQNEEALLKEKSTFGEHAYFTLLDEIFHPEGSIKRAGDIVAGNVVLSELFLTRINSAHFSMNNPIVDPRKAVLLLGMQGCKDVLRFIQKTNTSSVHSLLEEIASRIIER